MRHRKGTVHGRPVNGMDWQKNIKGLTGWIYHATKFAIDQNIALPSDGDGGGDNPKGPKRMKEPGGAARGMTQRRGRSATHGDTQEGKAHGREGTAR